MSTQSSERAAPARGYLVAVIAAAFLSTTGIFIRYLTLPYLAAYGLVLALFNALWALSVAVNGAAVGTVLVYSAGAMILGGVVLMRIYY